MPKKKPVKKKKRLTLSTEIRSLKKALVLEMRKINLDINNLENQVFSTQRDIHDLKTQPAKPIYKFEGLASEHNENISNLIQQLEKGMAVEAKPEGFGTDGKLCDYLYENFSQVGPSQDEVWDIIDTVKKKTGMPLSSEKRTSDYVDAEMQKMVKEHFAKENKDA